LRYTQLIFARALDENKAQIGLARPQLTQTDFQVNLSHWQAHTKLVRYMFRHMDQVEAGAIPSRTLIVKCVYYKYTVTITFNLLHFNRSPHLQVQFTITHIYSPQVYNFTF